MGDGNKDLVKTFIQVPRAAVDGYYNAPVILDPTPYAAGTYEEAKSVKDAGYQSDGFELSTLYREGNARSTSSTVSTSEVALKYTQVSDWSYNVDYNRAVNGYDFNSSYDYFLKRGFVIANASGIGTYGSEGFELCGLDLERDAMACVVEWLAGNTNRKAYARCDDGQGEELRSIVADWSNGRVAMTGASYGGTLPYEVATTGVEGLATIIPYSGIASWYCYTNSQGVVLGNNPSYTDYLAMNNAGACIEVNGEAVDFRKDYQRAIAKVAELEAKAMGNYTDIWESLDYAREGVNSIKCSALIVHGNNDFNVTMKQADLMKQAFDRSGNVAKMIIHQGAHENLYGNKVNGEAWEQLMNRWLCHYLLNVDNNVENDIPDVLYQDSTDGSWHAQSYWRNNDNTFNYREFAYASSIKDKCVISDAFGQY